MTGISAELEMDHELERQVLTRIIKEAENGNYDADSFEEFRSGLLRHIYLEEEIVFPAVLKNSPELRGQIAGLEMEHASVAMIMGKIADEIQTGNIIKSRKYLDEIERILAVHNSVESSGVYLKIPDNISMDIHSVVIPEGWVCRKLRKSRV